MIATYALCGFANVASIGIQIGAFSMLAPSRAKLFPRFALRAMIGIKNSLFIQNFCIKFSI